MPEPSYLSLSRRSFGKLAVGLWAGGAVGMAALAARGAAPRFPTTGERHDGPNASFLREQARRVVESALLRAGAKAGPVSNTTGYDLHVPGGNMGYPAFWVRDAVMMLGADLISAAELEGWIQLICSTLRGPEDWQVREGVTVPACAVPDHINFDGRPTFYPGNYQTGEKQGGHPWGRYPPLDDNFYFITAVYEHWKLTGDLRLLKSKVATGFGEFVLSDLCERVLRVPAVDPESALVIAGDVESQNAKDWGFCDSVFKSGKLLFPSILKLIAARQLSEMFAAAGDDHRAREYTQEAGRISAGIASTFGHPSEDGREVWLHSASGTGNQPDVWGSALAVWCGAVEGEIADRVSLALARGLRERTAIREGLVRHILTSDRVNSGGWERSVSGLGQYQNGGYWGTPVGWYIAGVHRTDAAAAVELGRDYIGFLRRNLRADGMTQAYEWLNPDTGQTANPLYAATVALPYLSLRAAGLLGVLDQDG